LAATNVTKGALYYHFDSKEALGHAIIEEVVAKYARDRWLLPLQQSEDKDPIDALIGIIRAMPARPRDLRAGCPLVNLAQEMSQLDEEFRKRLERISSTKFAFPQINQTNRFKPHHEKENEQ
jgi:AcrR family transcriptional regulator